MPDNAMYQETLDAIRQGQRTRARDLLTRLLRTDSSNPEYWLWMSSVVDSPKEQVYCLQSALRLDPENATARRGLTLLGATPPAETLAPVPPVRRRWEVATVEIPKGPGLGRFFNNIVVRVVFFSLLGIGIFSLIVYAVMQNLPQQSTVAVRYPTDTPGVAPTFTNTPTSINFTAPAVASTRQSPTPTGPPPLESLVEVSYTPTPLYASTPHAASETFSIAMRAYAQGDWERALRYMLQAAKIEPKAADIQFLVGEIYRFQGNFSEALAAYQKTLTLDANFAPAYLGTARVKLAQRPGSDVSSELQQAIRRDPNYGEAYLERASYLIARKDYVNAAKDLDFAVELLPGSPLVYLYRAEISLATGDFAAAMENAGQANELDRALLDAYRILGLAALASGDRDLARQNLRIYITYAPQNARALTEYGKILYEDGEYEAADQVLTTAITLDPNLAQAYLYRGLTRIELDQGQSAVNDMVKARSFNSANFAANLGFGRALFAADRLSEARSQLNIAEGLAATEFERAQVYYWRAQVNDALGEKLLAARDWNALLAISPTAVPETWQQTAQGSLATQTALVPTATSFTATVPATATPSQVTLTPTP